MRILVISDCHGSTANVKKVLDKYTDIKHLFYLGDGVRAIEEMQSLYPSVAFHIVEGNCDFNTLYKTVDIEIICGKKILYTHGHNFAVKYTTRQLAEKAHEIGADIVLYGHTHVSDITYDDGLYIINPGSIARGRENGNSYAIIDIAPEGIMPNIIKI